MLPSRYVPGGGQSSAMRKSRLEGKPSLLPKPRRPGSTDRLSMEARRSVAARSSSAEAPRVTFGGRLSREASASKAPLNGRSRSQTTDHKFGQNSMTPLRSSHYSRPTTTPQRTPSEDRANRSWHTSLDRALAFVTVKDTRQIASVSWQRSSCSRVQAELGCRGEVAALIRPLTIARFVDIVASLLNALMQDAKLNTDNYVAKLPHLVKRLLYPGTVSKSWLKTVNTLHAFPHALALVAYLLDLVNHIEMPVLDEWLYTDKDRLGCLRRDYLHKCWIRFQEPEHEFEDLNEEYLHNLRRLFGNDDEKIAELQIIIKKYSAHLEEEAESPERAHEQRLLQRRQLLHNTVKLQRAALREQREQIQAQRTEQHDMDEQIDTLTNEIQTAQSLSQQLKLEIEQQPLTVLERTRLLDEVYYAAKVQDSKRALADQIEKMLHSKELELASWQQRTLESCVQYKQGLIHLSADFPDLAPLAIDEKSLMQSSCSSQVSSGSTILRELVSTLRTRRTLRARDKTNVARQRHARSEETRTKISELQASIQREQQSLECLQSTESGEAASWSSQLSNITSQLEQCHNNLAEYNRVNSELEFWENTDLTWRTKLSSMQEAISKHKENFARILEDAKIKRAQLITDNIKQWYTKLDVKAEL